MKNREQRPKSDKALRQLSSGNKIKLGEVYRSVTSASLAHFPYKSAWAERTRQRALRARNKQTSRCARVACRSANPCRKRETKENEKKKQKSLRGVAVTKAGDLTGEKDRSHGIAHTDVTTTRAMAAAAAPQALYTHKAAVNSATT